MAGQETQNRIAFRKQGQKGSLKTDVLIEATANHDEELVSKGGESSES